MIKALIYDFDGVVIDSEPHFIQTEIKICSGLGIPLTEEIASEYLGLKMDDYISLLEKRFGVSIDHAVFASTLHKEVERLYRFEIPLVEHAADVLAELHSMFPTAVATSRERHLAQLIMKRLDIEKYFEKGVYREDVIKGKPDPEPYLRAAEILGVEPKFCAVIEDAENGFKSAKAAGMFVVARKAGYNKNQDFSLADKVVTDMREVPKILKGVQ